MSLLAAGALSIAACVPPEKSLEADVKELLVQVELEHDIVFCQTGDQSRTAMCVFDRSPDGPSDFVVAFGLRPFDAAQPDDAALLSLWSESVRCEGVGVFAPRFQRAVFRSPPNGDLYRLTHAAFEHIVLFDSTLRDQVCLQLRYAEGMEPGWR